jgi:hypothetical protein
MEKTLRKPTFFSTFFIFAQKDVKQQQSGHFLAFFCSNIISPN